MKNILIGLAALLVQTSSIAGPAVPFKLHDKEGLSLNEVARIRVANVHTWVESVDGKSLKTGLWGLLDKSEVQVLPGKHTISISHARDYKISFSLTSATLSHRHFSTDLELDAKAGHFYTVVFGVGENNQVWFAMRDHGTDYDDKCKILKDKVNTHIHINNLGDDTRVPQECY